MTASRHILCAACYERRYTPTEQAASSSRLRDWPAPKVCCFCGEPALRGLIYRRSDDEVPCGGMPGRHYGCQCDCCRAWGIRRAAAAARLRQWRAEFRGGMSEREAQAFAALVAEMENPE